MRIFTGNSAHGTGKEARYTARSDGSIRVVYGLGDGERALLTTRTHPELLAMVNAAKRAGGDAGGGGFVINEYRQVLVPTSKGILVAGTYTDNLEFSFEGKTIRTVAPASLAPGQRWPGPRVGIKYTVAAGCTDVRFPKGGSRDDSLTSHHSDAALAPLLAMIRRVKPGGGRIYINEASELFAPGEGEMGYVYIGSGKGHPWFPKPS